MGKTCQNESTKDSNGSLENLFLDVESGDEGRTSTIGEDLADYDRGAR